MFMKKKNIIVERCSREARQNGGVGERRGRRGEEFVGVDEFYLSA